MIDAANWGQDWENIMLNNASQVASADSLNNTIFSVHMYQVYQNYSKIQNYISGFLDCHKSPLVIGEFGTEHKGEFVDAGMERFTHCAAIKTLAGVGKTSKVSDLSVQLS